MKTAKLILASAAIFFIAACNKTQVIPPYKENYIGVWQPEKPEADKKIELVIKSDGTGRYATYKKNSTVEYAGNVYFKNDNQFSIGGKLFKKKIEVQRAPVKIIDSIKPLKFHYEAEFDNVKFRRAE